VAPYKPDAAQSAEQSCEAQAALVVQKSLAQPIAEPLVEAAELQKR